MDGGSFASAGSQSATDLASVNHSTSQPGSLDLQVYSQHLSPCWTLENTQTQIRSKHRL